VNDRTDTTALESLIDSLSDEVGDALQQVDWAEDEIAAASARHRHCADTLFHCFSLLEPTHPLMRSEMVYRAHCRELLDRLAAEADTRAGTAAEVCLACRDASMTAPLSPYVFGLHARMWRVAFPERRDPFVDCADHYEQLYRDRIDQLEAEARRAPRRPDRRLGPIACRGLHHARPVRCRHRVTSPSATRKGLRSA
jgi:hypothetical protein